MKNKFSETEIWNWLESKNFSELSPEEKSTVLSSLSKEEYQHMRILIRKASQQLAHTPEGLQLRPGMDTIIFQQGKRKKKNLLNRLITYRIPAWQAAAAAVFFALTFYSLGNTTSSGHSNLSKSAYTTDSLLGISLAEDSSLSRFMVESL